MLHIYTMNEHKTPRESFKIDKHELCYFATDDADGFEEVQREITDTSRHGHYVELITKRESDGKFFMIRYEDSVKDECSLIDMNYDGSEADEVFPTQVTKTIYQ